MLTPKWPLSFAHTVPSSQNFFSSPAFLVCSSSLFQTELKCHFLQEACLDLQKLDWVPSACTAPPRPPHYPLLCHCAVHFGGCLFAGLPPTGRATSLSSGPQQESQVQRRAGGFVNISLLNGSACPQMGTPAALRGLARMRLSPPWFVPLLCP